MLARHKIRSPERKRDAKKLMRKMFLRYKPSVYQKQFTTGADIKRIWSRADSFDSLVRGLAALAGKRCPDRPRS